MPRALPLAVLACASALSSSSCGDDCGEWSSYAFDPRLRMLTNTVAVGTGGALAVQRPSQAGPGYEPRDSGTTEDLLDVWADGNYFECTFVAVGRKGTVRISTDDGERWRPVDAPAIAADLRGVDVDCGNDSYAVAVGDAGAVLVGRLSGDAPWVAPPPPTALRLNAVSLAINQRAVAVGERGLVLRSLDGGMTWTEVPVDTTEDLLDIELDWDAGTGYIVGAAGTLLQGSLGLGWTRVDSGVDDDLRQVIELGGFVRILGEERLFTWDFTRTGPLVADHELGRPLVAVTSRYRAEKGGGAGESMWVIAEGGRVLSYLHPSLCEDVGYH